MDYQQALQYLESFINYERWLLSAAERQKFNLDRMHLLLRYIGEPHKSFKSIHVAGSKGKGSTANMIASILSSAGYKTGLYTSPHLISFRERIKINGDLISELELSELVEKLKPAVEEFRRESKFGDATFFEIYTALAFKFFADQKVDFAVIEVGLGGRLDATNVINPLIAAITPISFEHMGILGDTITKIAFEKSGIIKAHVPTITSPQLPEALEVIRATAAQKGSPLSEVGVDLKFERESFSDLRQEFSLIMSEMFQPHPVPLPSKEMRKEVPIGIGKEYRLEIPLLGKHQIVNAATAVGAIEILKSSGFPISTNAIRSGLKAVRLPGRIQVLRRAPTIIVDTSHNVASAKALRQTIVETFNYNKFILIAGFLLDKEIGKIGFELCPLADIAILTKAANTPRAAEPKNILQQWEDMCHNIKTGNRVNININIIIAPDVGEALRVAESMASGDDLICITGSFYIAGEALEILGGRGRV